MPRATRTTTVVAVSLPTPIAEKIEHIRKVQNRSRSAVVGDAMRVYFRAQEIAEEAEEGRRAYLEAKAGHGLSPVFDSADAFLADLHRVASRQRGPRRISKWKKK